MEEGISCIVETWAWRKKLGSRSSPMFVVGFHNSTPRSRIDAPRAINSVTDLCDILLSWQLSFGTPTTYASYYRSSQLPAPADKDVHLH